MKLSLRGLICLVLCLPFLISSCSIKEQPLSDSFLEISSVEAINQKLVITLQSNTSREIHVGTGVQLIIINETEDVLLIRKPDGIRLFISLSGDWMEISNNVNYFGDSDGQVLEPSNVNSLNSVASITINPMLDPSIKITDNTPLRILVIAEKMMEGTPSGEQLASFLDLYLVP